MASSSLSVFLAREAKQEDRERRRFQYQRRKLQQPPSRAIEDVALYILMLEKGHWNMCNRFLEASAQKPERASGAVRPRKTQEPRHVHVREPERAPPPGWTDVVRSRWLSLTPAEEESILNSADRVTQVRLARAQRFLNDFKLEAWVTLQNAKGVAPSGPSARMQKVRLSEAAPGTREPRVSTLPKSGRVVGKHWLGRWAKRVSVTRGLFAVGNSLPVEEMRLKVHVRSDWSAENLCGAERVGRVGCALLRGAPATFCGPKMRPFFRLKMRTKPPFG